MDELPEEQKTPVARQSSPVRSSQNLVSSRVRSRSRYSLPPKTPVRTPSRTRSGSTQRLRRVSAGETPKLKRHSNDGRTTPTIKGAHGNSPRRNSIRRIPTTPYALRALKTLTPRGARRQSAARDTPNRENSQYTPTKDLRSLSRLLLKERNQGNTESHNLSTIENKSTTVHETLPLPDLSEFTDIAMPEGVVQRGIFSPAKPDDQELFEGINQDFNQDVESYQGVNENNENGTFSDEEPLFGMDLSLLEPAVGASPPKKSSKPSKSTNSLLPKSMILKMVKFKTGRTTIGPNLYPTLQSISDDFFTQVSEDLCRYAEHGRRSMVNFTDIQLLTQRINKNLASVDNSTEHSDIMTLARESLDLEQLMELENMMHLNQMQKSTKKKTVN